MFRYNQISHGHVFEPIREIRSSSVFVSRFTPCLSHGALHVVITLLVHFFHHVHQASLRIIFILLLRIFLCKLNHKMYTLSSLKANWAHDLLLVLINVKERVLVLRRYLLSLGMISPHNFLIAKIRFWLRYPLSLTVTDSF